MSSVIVEHVMLLPLMLIGIVLFSATANAAVLNYVNQQIEVIAQGAINQMTSLTQQLYYALDQENIASCNVTLTRPMPELIGSYTYDIYATATVNNELSLSLFVSGVTVQVEKIIVLSPNAQWNDSHYRSISSTAAIKVEKSVNGTLLFSFM